MDSGLTYVFHFYRRYTVKETADGDLTLRTKYEQFQAGVTVYQNNFLC